MDDVTVLISGIEFKTLQLLGKYDALLTENREIKKELTELKQIIEQQKKQIQQSEEKNKILQIAKSIQGEDNKTKAKLRINELLREIDRCLALLNK